MPQIIIGIIIIVLVLELLKWVWANIATILLVLGLLTTAIAFLAALSKPQGRAVLGKIAIAALVVASTLTTLAVVGLCCGRLCAALDSQVARYLMGWVVMGAMWGTATGGTWALWQTNRVREALAVIAGVVLLPASVLVIIA